MTATKINEAERQILIAEIEAANLESPEQVADLVLSDADAGGIEAGRARLARCIDADRRVTAASETAVAGNQIQHDNSGVGHNWRNIDAEDIPAQVRLEIEGEIIDGEKETVEDYVASNGLHYRW